MRTPTLFIVLTAIVLTAAPAGAATINLTSGDSIQAAIDAASGGDEIVLAAGTYVESIDFLGKAITVRSASGDPADTIIDGNGAFHVVQCVSGEGAGTVLERVTITGGNADGSVPNDRGGGMYNSGSSPTVTNCTFVDNMASQGGGMHNDGGSPVVTDCTFLDNSAGAGAAIGSIGSSSTVINCTFAENTAVSGGGIYGIGNFSLTVTGCTFSGNLATSPANGGQGGGIYDVSSNVTLTNCTFNGNHADVRGGGMDIVGSNLTLTNCMFSGNAANYGGGMYNDSYSATVTSCTFNANTAGSDGGGMYNFYQSPTVTNCILWGDSPNEIFNIGSSNPVVSYCDVAGGYVGLFNINADPLFADADGADNIVGTLDDDLRLLAYSPCIDAGDSASVPVSVVTDLDGNPRFVDDLCMADTGSGGATVVDMGAYERQSGSGPVTFNLTPADSIQDAINAAGACAEIVLAAGIYDGGIDFLGKAVTVRSASGNPLNTIIHGNGALHVVQCVTGEGPGTVLEGVTITGGNANGVGLDARGGGLYIVSSSPTVTNCMISGNTGGQYGGGMYNSTGSSPTVTDCVFTGNTAGIGGGGGMCNFLSSNPTVTNCTFGGNTSDFGGGVFNQESSPMVTNCTFSGNMAGEGGGMHNFLNSSPTVTGCAFTGNTVDAGGGGMFNQQSSPTLSDCTFSANTATIAGGGMYNVQGSAPVTTNCRFNGNSAGPGGGGAMGNNLSSSPTVTNCTFSGNTAYLPGAMANFQGSHPTVTNCTFAWNSRSMHNFQSSPTVTNCILWGNSGEISNADHDSIPVVTYCNVAGGYAGLGNIDADPLFADADGADNIVGTLDDNLRLTTGSSCVDAGDDAAVPVGVTTDADGNDRFTDGDGNGVATVDMGAYELAPPPCVGDTNDNGAVDVDDLVSVILDWGTDGSANGGDVNGSGVVDVDDLVAVILAWGDCR